MIWKFLLEWLGRGTDVWQWLREKGEDDVINFGYVEYLKDI